MRAELLRQWLHEVYLWETDSMQVQTECAQCRQRRRSLLSCNNPPGVAPRGYEKAPLSESTLPFDLTGAGIRATPKCTKHAAHAAGPGRTRGPAAAATTARRGRSCDRGGAPRPVPVQEGDGKACQVPQECR